MDKNNKLIIIGIIAIIGVFLTVLLIGASLNTTPEAPVTIKNMNVKSGDFDTYYLVGNITANKEFDYLEARAVFYDENNNTIGSCPIAWNMIDVKKGENITIDNMMVATVSGTPKMVVISFYDYTGSDDSLVNFTVHFNGTSQKVVNTAPTVKTVDNNKKYSEEDLEQAKESGYWDGYSDSLDDYNTNYKEDDYDYDYEPETSTSV